MRLFDEADLENARAEGRAEGIETERARLLGLLETPEGQRNAGGVLTAALVDPRIDATNVAEQMKAAPASGEAGISARELYARLNSKAPAPAAPAAAGDVYTRASRGG